MEMRLETPDTAETGDADVMLAAKLDQRASAELIDQLRARRGGDIVLNAGAVDHLGAHAVQTLLVAAKTWSKDGHSFAIRPISDPALADLTTLGLDAESLQTGGTP